MSAASFVSGALLRWPDLTGRPKPRLKPQRLRYGDDRNQRIDLWRPPTPGPHPVVALLHGGCWTASVASLHLMDWACADLAARGVAVWNIEYRRLEQPGGGYPGTYLDVGAALDRLTAEAAQRGLLTGDGLVVAGHSAGAHLALWSAGRAQLAAEDALFTPRPAPVRAVVAISGLADLEHDTATACGPEPVAAMVGPQAYRSTSPAHMLPLGADLHLVYAAQDETVPPAVGERFAALARAAGDTVALLTPPGGHVEEIAPGTQAWEATAQVIQELTRPVGAAAAPR